MTCLMRAAMEKGVTLRVRERCLALQINVSQTYCPNLHPGLVLAELSLDVTDHALFESRLD